MLEFINAAGKTDSEQQAKQEGNNIQWKIKSVYIVNKLPKGSPYFRMLNLNHQLFCLLSSGLKK